MSSYAYQELVYPGSDGTRATSINDSGSVVGMYSNPMTDAGFLYQSDGTYSALPGGSPYGGNFPWDINDLGNIIGDNFIIVDGVTKSLSAFGSSYGTFATSLNNSDQVVGIYIDSGRNGFSYIDGSYTTISAPGATDYTTPTAINDSGEIIGYYSNTGAAGYYFGFVETNGTFTSIPTPENVFRLVPSAINSEGDIAGFYENDDTTYDAFVYANGTFTTLSGPQGAADLTAVDINDAGDVVGNFTDPAGNNEGFIYRDGVFTTISDPNAVGGTTVVGLNNTDQIIGTYKDSDREDHSFVASLACFQRGTCLATPKGDLAVERLVVGDFVLTSSGIARRILWIGHRHVDCARHARPCAVRPIEIAPHAFGVGMPRRPLRISPDHAVYAEGVLVPIKHLVNGGSIRQVDVEAVTYFHVELDRHDIVLAEGIPCESYLDTGRRHAFVNGKAPAMLHPAFDRDPDTAFLWESLSYASLVVSGPVFERVRESVNARAKEMGEAGQSCIASVV